MVVESVGAERACGLLGSGHVGNTGNWSGAEGKTHKRKLEVRGLIGLRTWSCWGTRSQEGLWNMVAILAFYELHSPILSLPSF